MGCDIHTERQSLYPDVLTPQSNRAAGQTAWDRIRVECRSGDRVNSG